MFAFDVAATLAAVTGVAALAWTAATWVVAQRHKKATAKDRREVDAIRVSHDALAGTIQLQHEDNERLRTRLFVVERDHAQCMMSLDRLSRALAAAGIKVPPDE